MNITNDDLNKILRTHVNNFVADDYDENSVKTVQEKTDIILTELSNKFSNLSETKANVYIKDGRVKDGDVAKILTVDIDCSIDGNHNVFTFSL